MRVAFHVLCASTLLLSMAGCHNNSSNSSSTTTEIKETAQVNTVPVTAKNFARAESDRYMGDIVKQQGLMTIKHNRRVASVDSQLVIRLNQDVLYSQAVFDLDAGPVTITIPNPGKRFLSIQVINEDHYSPMALFGGGVYKLSKASAGTRYAMVALRMFVDPNDPKDMQEAHELQDKVKVEQPGGPGKFEIPVWDKASQDRVRDSLLVEARSKKDFTKAFGTKKQVDPVNHLLGTAGGWGGNPESVAVYSSITPEKNDGTTNYTLHVPARVPVDAFWSVTVYNEKGYLEKNPYNVNSLNSVTARKNGDGSVDIRFGNCDGKKPNCIPIVKGWNYTVRMYRPRHEILAGLWKFPEVKEVK